MGLNNAYRYILTGDWFGAEEAYRLGLVQQVVPDGQALQVAIEIAEELFTAPIVMASRKLKRYIADTRAKAGVETPLEWFEWLADQMLRRRQNCPTPPAYVEHKNWKP